ncbi:MAG TPA: helix-turn-helix transcriptional regulator [Rectinemataceae bacterium]|nr:helix-turn-helix transcriptional regulator [Rectinemataceae bacterium]
MDGATLRNNFRRWRLLVGLTQEDAAAKIGVTRQTVIAIEKGNYQPSVLLALKSAKTFGCSVEELFYVE